MVARVLLRSVQTLDRDPGAVQRQLEQPEVVANDRVQAAYDEAMSRARVS